MKPCNCATIFHSIVRSEDWSHTQHPYFSFVQIQKHTVRSIASVGFTKLRVDHKNVGGNVMCFTQTQVLVSLVPRPSLAPVFDRLQYAKNGRRRVAIKNWSRGRPGNEAKSL